MKRTLSAICILASSLISTAAWAEPFFVCELTPGTAPATIATRYSLALTDQTDDGRFAKYEAPTAEYASSIEAQVASDSQIASYEIQSTNVPLKPRKGSTIPAVGERHAPRVANAHLLGQIGWNAGLANSSGRAVRVAILDNGIASNRSDLWSRVDKTLNVIEPNLLPIDRPMQSDTNGDGVLDGGTGHGTFAAEIIATVAPRVRFIVARIADSDGNSNPQDIALGIQFAIDNGAEVINLGFGSSERSTLIDDAVKRAESAGILVVSGSGNDGLNRPYFPAMLKGVVSVGAIDENGLVASYSNAGGTIDVYAPGYSFQSATEQWSGTSFSTAYVAGLVSDCLRRTNRRNIKSIMSALAGAGTPVPGASSTSPKRIDHTTLDSLLRS